PSSFTLKSVVCRPRTGWPLESVTDTGIIIRFESVLITSKSSSFGGAGVGVGLGVGSGGGGGISIIFCPAAGIKKQKRDSTAKSSAVPNCFPTRSRFIKPFLMPPELASHRGRPQLDPPLLA